MADKGILKEDKPKKNSNNKSKRRKRTLKFSQQELENVRQNGNIDMTKDELSKYNWSSINKLCRALKVKGGGTKDTMIGNILEKIDKH